METTLFKSPLSEAIQRLKEILVKQGFLVREVDAHNKVLVAYQHGSWHDNHGPILFELSSINNNLTRMDVTASVENNTENGKEEEVIAERIVSIMHKNS